MGCLGVKFRHFPLTLLVVLTTLTLPCERDIFYRPVRNKGMAKPNFSGVVELADFENHTIEPKITTLFYMQPKLRQIFWKNSQFFVTMATGVV